LGGTRSTASVYSPPPDASPRRKDGDRVEPVPPALHEEAPPYRGAAAPEGNGRTGGGPLRFIDLFCGIGGFRLAFERACARCVFSSDWDKYSRQTYAASCVCSGQNFVGDSQRTDRTFFGL
jgi:C-5 cytosine-specific DNA methylase